MTEHSAYYDKWKLSWVVAYLMEFYFGNKPTSNKNLSEAFWRRMGKNVEFGGQKRWTDGKRGVPYHIHRLTKEYILAEVPSEERHPGTEFPEYTHSYVLGDRRKDTEDGKRHGVGWVLGILLMGSCGRWPGILISIWRGDTTLYPLCETKSTMSL